MRIRGGPRGRLWSALVVTLTLFVERFNWERMPPGACPHLATITAIKRPKQHECEECIKIGSPWVHLRTCQTCGVTLCCDSSPKLLRPSPGSAGSTATPMMPSPSTEAAGRVRR